LLQPGSLLDEPNSLIELKEDQRNLTLFLTEVKVPLHLLSCPCVADFIADSHLPAQGSFNSLFKDERLHHLEPLAEGH